MSKQTEAIDNLVECARLLGHVEANKRSGNYTREDSLTERAMYESITKHRAVIREALTQRKPLSEAAIEGLANFVAIDDFNYDFARAIEKAHGVV
jgi:hypothetical protein